MPWKLVIPPVENKIAEIDDWGVFTHPLTAKDSPLWPCIRVVRLVGRRRIGRLRAVWLYWGVDERRLKRGKYQRRLEAEQPTVYAAVVRLLGELLTPERLERRFGTARLAAERARLAVSKAKHIEHDLTRDLDRLI